MSVSNEDLDFLNSIGVSSTNSNKSTATTATTTTIDDDMMNIFGSASTTTTAAATATTTTPAINNTIDNDLNDIFNSSATKSPISTLNVITKSTPDTYDELNSLINTPPADKKNEEKQFNKLINPSIDVGLIDVEGDAVKIKTLASSKNNSNDLLDFMDSIDSPKSTSPNPIDKKGRSVSQDDREFLSWLGESPQSSPTHADTVTSSKLQIKKPPSLNVVNRDMDSFFDEIFGNSANEIESGRSTPQTQKRSMKSFMAELKEAIESSFPDVENLRKLLMDAGYIPVTMRGQIWSLLLTGSCNEDQEIKSFKPNDNAIPNQSRVLSDCDAVVNKWIKANGGSSIDSKQIRQDLNDILVLYSLRREVEYSPLFCNLLAPLLLNPSPFSRGLASTSFYALTSNFMPLVNLQAAALEVAVDLLHSWLRLLLSYHNPSLVQHLDRVLPGWEMSTSVFSATDAAFKASDVKTSADLDMLERELGIDNSDDIGATWTASGGDDGPVESAHAQNRQGGCIPLHWICGMFAGSIPADQSCYILDWSLLENERYLGLYMTAALLEIYSPWLVTVNGPTIRSWLEEIAAGQGQWYQFAPFKQSKYRQEEASFLNDSENLSWTDFTCGWLHATFSLQRNTPQGFKEAVLHTEEWAEKTILKKINKNDDEADGLNSWVTVENTVNLDDFEDKNKVSAEPKKLNIMEQFKRLSVFQPKTKSEENDNEDFSSLSHHDTKGDLETMCLWADVAEVIPCICSNRRRPGSQEDILLHFETGIIARRLVAGSSKQADAKVSDEVRGGDDMCLPLSEPSSSSPFYFGIDCRTDLERSLGQFPKAFAIDPSSITDSDAILQLLDTLEPLVNSVHLCIIGVGEEYVRKVNSNKDKDSIQKSLAEYRARLNAVAMFFMKKSFNHVSILDGGFINAAKYLRKIETTFSLTSSLIDVDTQTLDEMLLGTAVQKNTNLFAQMGGKIAERFEAIKSQANIENVQSFLFGEDMKVGSNNKNDQIQASKPPVNNSNNTNNANNEAIDKAKEKAKEVFSGIGRKLSIFGSSSLETLKKIGVVTNAEKEKDDIVKKNSTFVIDDEEEDDGMGPREEDPTKISISRTDAERLQALALHKVAGLTKGDQFILNRENLPGAVLFPAIKYKIAENPNEDQKQSESNDAIEPDYVEAKRFIAITKERFLVLDADESGVGSLATVKSNHHLTELLKMTFKKKDPDLISLFFVSGKDTKTRIYRVNKRKEFTELLQKNMMKFK